jgi:hypothetical protein
MDKSTYKTLLTLTEDLQRRFDFMFKAVKVEPTLSTVDEDNHEDAEVINPIAAEVSQGLDTTSHQEESTTALEDSSSVYTELPADSQESGLQNALSYIMKVTSPQDVSDSI